MEEDYFAHMVDPNDFVDKNEPEGEEAGNPKAGQEGVGGLSTEDAEEAYENAAKQHFKDQQNTQDTSKPDDNDVSDRITDKDQKPNENVTTPPQIGSLDDDEITVD